jgi:transposase
MYYIGLDVHKRTISYCVKDGSGKIYAESTIPATRFDLDRWMRTLPQPWTAAMEATVFTGWIYDHLLPHAVALKVAHPLMLRAIAAVKKKNDRIDASKICDCLRCDFLPECYMASTALRERRRTLRKGCVSKWKSGSNLIGTAAERPTHAVKNPKTLYPRSSPACQENLS